MGPIEITIIVLSVAVVLAVGIVAIVKKLKGKSGGCRCGCSGCPHASMCKSNKPETNAKETL